MPDARERRDVHAQSLLIYFYFNIILPDTLKAELYISGSALGLV